MVDSRDNPTREQNSDDLAGQLRQMQGKMREAQAELAKDTLTVTASGEAVTIVISGAQVVQSVRMSQEFLQSSDPELVSNILVAVINDAIVQSQALAASRLESITGDLGLQGV